MFFIFASGIPRIDFKIPEGVSSGCSLFSVVVIVEIKLFVAVQGFSLHLFFHGDVEFL